MSENSMYTRLLVYSTLAMPISCALYTSLSNRSSLAWYAIGALTRGEVRIKHRKLGSEMDCQALSTSMGTRRDEENTSEGSSSVWPAAASVVSRQSEERNSLCSLSTSEGEDVSSSSESSVDASPPLGLPSDLLRIGAARRRSGSG